MSAFDAYSGGMSNTTRTNPDTAIREFMITGTPNGIRNALWKTHNEGLLRRVAASSHTDSHDAIPPELRLMAVSRIKSIRTLVDLAEEDAVMRKAAIERLAQLLRMERRRQRHLGS